MPPPAHDQYQSAASARRVQPTGGGARDADPHRVTARRAGQGRNGLLVALAGGHAMKHVFVSGLFVLLPEIKASLGLSNAGLGVIATARSLSGGLANAPAGFLADRYRRHFSPMLAGMLVYIAVFQLALSRSVGLIDAAIYAAALAVAFTAWHPPAIGVLSQVFSDRRGLAISIHGTGASVGETLGPLLAGALLLVLSWETVLQVAAVPALAAAFIVWLMTRRYEMVSVHTSVGGYLRVSGQLLRNRQLLMILLVAGAFGGGQTAVFVFLPVYIREDLGRSTITVGLWLAMAQGVGIVSQPVMGYLLDRLGHRTVIVPALLVLAAALFTMYYAEEGILFLAALAVAGAFLFSTTSLIVTAAVVVTGDRVPATTVSLVYSALAVFTAIGPLLAGFIADQFSVRAVFALAGSMVLVAGSLAMTARMRPAPA